VAFFFGGSGNRVFDLGEVDAEFVLPISEDLTVSLAAKLPTGGASTITLGWTLAL